MGLARQRITEGEVLVTQVFLSHSTRDAEMALRLADDLRAAGVPVWKAPESIMEGEEWIQAIQRGLATSTHFLLLQSPAAVASRWVKFEFDAALALYMKDRMRIIPVDYLPCEAPLFWQRFQLIGGIADDYYGALFQIQAQLRDDQPAHPPEPTLPATTINVTVQGSVSGTMNVAGHDISYAGQPEAPPESAAPVLPYAVPAADDSQMILDIAPPPFAWCEIPAGQVTLEGGYQMADYEATFDVQPFFMAKYPITHEQFQVFVEADDGFSNDRWWTGLAAAQGDRSEAGLQAFTYAANLPRDSVNWYDAVAFCRWLSERTGQTIRLPTEWEWQWAAAGPKGFKYPWGNSFDGSRATTSAGLGLLTTWRTTPVDRYPDGASHFGVMDLIGNLYDLCLNEYRNPDNTDLSGNSERAARGGSYSDSDIETGTRQGRDPGYRNPTNGFRIVRIPRSDGS